MGYTTEFKGAFATNKKMPATLVKKLREFSDERHGGDTQPFAGFPGFWCDWVPTPDAKGIQWSGAEKFYNYEAWLQLIMDRFLTPAGITLTGTVRYRGEDFDDIGTLTIENGQVKKRPYGGA